MNPREKPQKKPEPEQRRRGESRPQSQRKRLPVYTVLWGSSLRSGDAKKTDGSNQVVG